MNTPLLTIAATLALQCLLPAQTPAPKPTVIIAEGELFSPLDGKGWKPVHQEFSYASHTYGGMWSSNGGLLGAPAASDGSAATLTVQVPVAGKYRVWSKYQAPPYFNYLHRIEVSQNGRTVHSHVYGKNGTDRLWSFSGQSDELWWFWGVDHDAAEAPKEMIDLAAGPAEIKLVAVANPKPAGDRFIDFVVLTTEPGDTYTGFKPYGVGSPFCLEAIANTKLYARFKNTTGKPARVDARTAGHFQPLYGSQAAKFPAADVAPGEWSEWFNIAAICRLVHDEGVWLKLADGAVFDVQVARDADGRDLVGDMKVTSGEAIVIPIDVVWNKKARVIPSAQHAAHVVAAVKTWRTANGGRKPEKLAFYGAFNGADALKDALGYNTRLPDNFQHLKPDNSHHHVFGAEAIRKFAEKLTPEQRAGYREISFGDEIGLGEIAWKDPAMQARFTAWLKEKKITKEDLGIEPGAARLQKDGPPRLAWYANLFNEEERFSVFRESVAAAEQAFGKDVLCGANYSPHHLALCYGPIFQWVDLFKHKGMTMHWSEDYIFSVPEVPQIISWMFAEMRCGVKYHHQPIHFYVMPHAPGQTPENLRRNMVFAVGSGAATIDSFWVAPAETFTENFVSWGSNETFRVLHESIFDSGEVEAITVGGKVRPARVAVIIGKATDYNESRLMIEKERDPFLSRSKNASPKTQQTIDRKDQQMLYLALRQAQHGVELITEDDIADLDVLRNYSAVYFAGEWIDRRAVRKLDAWVKDGGILYATAGLGRMNEFGEPDPGMNRILGLEGATIDKNLYVSRTLLELPLAAPIGTITLDGGRIPAIGMKQILTPGSAKVIGTWEDGKPAVTVNEHGKGRAFAVGTLAGSSYMKTALRVTPWARGGRLMVYHPTDFDPAATRLVRLGVDARSIAREVECSVANIEATVMDGSAGTVVTLVNWNNAPVKDVKVTVRMPSAPASARSVEGQKAIQTTYADGAANFVVSLNEADFIVLKR